MLDMPNQFRLLVFQHFTPQFHIIHLSIVSVLSYNTTLTLSGPGFDKLAQTGGGRNPLPPPT